MNAPKEHESTVYYQPMLLSEGGLLKQPKHWNEPILTERYSSIEAVQAACENEGGWTDYVIVTRISVREKL